MATFSASADGQFEISMSLESLSTVAYERYVVFYVGGSEVSRTKIATSATPASSYDATKSGLKGGTQYLCECIVYRGAVSNGDSVATFSKYVTTDPLVLTINGDSGVDYFTFNGTKFYDGDELTYNYNQPIAMKVYLEDGYSFSKWTTSPTFSTINNKTSTSISFNMPNYDMEVTASTTKKRHLVGITYGLGISSGTMTGDIVDGNAAEGTSVTFKATVKDGYTFYGWYDSNGNKISSSKTYSQTITQQTILTANAIPETLFSASTQSIEITTISEGIDEIILYHNGSEIDSTSFPSDNIITFDSGIYPSSTYDIEIGFNFGAVEEYSVTTSDPTLSATVDGNAVTVEISGGRAYKTTSWSSYPSGGTLSGGSYEATFSGLAYNTTYVFYCTYRVASGTSYTSSPNAIEVTATTEEAPKFTISLSRDTTTVASFNKNPNRQFEYGEWVTLTATAPSDTYQYIYSTPIIYYGTSSSGEQASSTGSLDHYVTQDQSFYAKGSRKTRSYSATATAEYVSSTSQKIIITDLSSTSGLNSYYYITSATSSSPVASLSSAKSFSRSTGSITLTGLSSGEYTYYCYVYNSTYGYYYLIDSVTFTAGARVEYWKWYDETERAAFEGEGEFKVLTASRWKAFCEKFNEIIDAGGYATSLKITIPSGLTSGSVLTAEHFNHVTNQIMWFSSAWMNKPEYQQLFERVNPGDPVLGQYFIDLETAVNDLIDAL